MNSRLSLTKHASGSGGILRESSQKVGWRESLGRWAKVGLLAGVALGSALPTTGFSDPIVTSGLIAYYPCNGNVNDTSGNNNHGTPTGVTYTADRRGETNTACSFNGSSYIQITGKRFNLSENTLVGWVKWNGGATDPSRSYGIVSNYSGSNKTTSGLQQYGLKMANANSDNYASFFYDNGLANAAGFKGVTSRSPLSDGQWHFMAAVFKGGKEADIYVDSIKYVNLSDQIPPISVSPSNDLYIGRDGLAGETKGGLNWKGVIDDFRLYNRALTDAELFQLFQVIELANGTTFIPNPDGGFKVLDSEYPMTVTEKPDGTFLVKATKRFPLSSTRSVRANEPFDIDPTTMEATITPGDGGISVVDTTTPHLTSTFNQDGTTVVTDSASGITGTLKEGKITVKDNENPTMTATFDVNSGKGTVFTDSEFPSAAVTFNSNGTYSVTDAELPTSTATISPNGTVTVADTELPGAQMTLNSNGSLTVVDPESPTTTTTFSENGTQTVTDEEYPGVVATVDKEENYTITDQEFPNVVLTVNNDGTYTLNDGHECLVATATDLENTRSVRGFFKNILKKAVSFVKKVVTVVKKVVSVVKTVVSKIVPVVKKFLAVGISFVKKVAGFFKGFGGFLNKAWCYLKCYVFPAIKGLITKILPVLAPVAIIAGVAGVAIFAYKVIKFLKAKNQQQIQYVEETVEVAEPAAQPVEQQGTQMEDNLPPPSEGQSTLSGTKSRSQDAGRMVREATPTLNCPKQPLPEIFTNPETGNEGANNGDNTNVTPVDNGLTISNSTYTMVVKPNPTPGPETDMQVVDNGNGTYTGTNGLVVVDMKPNGNGNGNDNEFTIITGKEVTGTGEASSVKVTANPDGSHSIADANSPSMAMTLHDDGTSTVTDTESPGMVATLNSDGSSSVTDEASPGTVFTVTPEGTSTVTDTAYPDLTTTINPDGSTTVTDITAPGLEITLQPDGRSIAKDTTTGMTAESNSDGTYHVIDPEAPGMVTIVNSTDGTAKVIDQATGECVTADSETKRGTRGFFSSFKKTVNRATNFVNNITGRVNKATQKVNKVAGVVNKAANFVTKYAPFVNKVATLVQTWALGRAANAGPVGNCIFCAIAGVAGKIAGVTTPGSPFLGFVTNVANFSKKVMTVSSTVSKVATTVSKVATTVRNVVNAVGKFFGWNMLHFRSIRADTSPNCSVVTPEEGPYTALGTIKDKLGPVAGVTVQIAGKTATTDASGNWQITGLTAGNYTAEATQDGYLSLIQQFEVSEAMPKANVPLKLTSLLKVQVSTQPKVAKQNDNVTYLVNVTNNGTRPATSLVLKDLIPEGTTLISVEGDHCDTHTVSCTLPDLAPGNTAKVKLVVNAPQAGNQANTAQVTANNYPADSLVTVKEILPTLSALTNCTPNPVPMLTGLHCVVEVNLSQYATAPATGLKVVTTLPNGVELQTAKTDFGTCDTTQLPKVTCTLNDLPNGTIDTKATLNFDMTLKDAGLLVLTQETTVSSDNYGSHLSRARTTIKIPADLQVDLALVIDITGSMQGEIDGVKAALKKFIATLDPASSPLVALIVFKDDVTVKAFTKDMNVLLKAIEALKADGGGTCPEASVEAVGLAAHHVKPGGQVWFTTDASPYPDADVQGALDLLQSKNIRFNATVTGDCTTAGSANDDQWQQVVNGK